MNKTRVLDILKEAQSHEAKLPGYDKELWDELIGFVDACIYKDAHILSCPGSQGFSPPIEIG